MDTRTVQFYDQRAEALAAGYGRAEVTALHELLARWVPKGSQVLELGCGCGREAAFLAGQGCQVLATDASEEMLAQAGAFLAARDLARQVELAPAAFPLTPSHPLLTRKFDAVVAVAMLMHLPEHELFDFAYQIRGLLEPGGVFLCSFCAGGQPEDDPRLHQDYQPAELQLLFERLGFRLLVTTQNADGMGRARTWTTMVFSLASNLGSRPVDQLESIINRDKKSATYKLALLRALCELAQTSVHVARFLPDGRVTVPLGMVVEKWLYYYWPLLAPLPYLPEKLQDGKDLGFRGALVELMAASSGGLDGFFAAFQTGRLGENQERLLVEAVNLVAKTIIKGPAYFAGGSLQGQERIFAVEGPQSLRRCPSPQELAQGLGRLSFPAELWREMCLVGHWISEAIVLRWAELSYHFAHKAVPVPEILARLLVRPEADRDVTQAKRIWTAREDLTCVWTGKPLGPERLAVDHVIPFSLWHNNELWNLLPAHPKVNQEKRDRVVGRQTLVASRDRVVDLWQWAHRQAPERFEAELGRTLLGGRFPKTNWEAPAFGALAEAMETLAIQRGVARWEAGVAREYSGPVVKLQVPLLAAAESAPKVEALRFAEASPKAFDPDSDPGTA
jgi:SAM-dependent methyltransferase